MRKLLMLVVAAGLIAAGVTAPALAAPLREPVVVNALDGVFAAFHRRPVVLLGDAHHVAQEGAFYAALVRDPRFAREVGDVVVEFGGAAHQEIIDRYENGEDVPYVELRRVWTDLVGAETPASQMYSNFFAVVRQVNAKLPPDRRIRVWLGEPPIDWTKLRSFNDLDPYMVQRDTYPAGLVNHLLGQGKKALVIYGPAHFLFSPLGPARDMRSLVEHAHRGSTYLILPYAGFAKPGCAHAFERRARGWRAPSLAAPVAGTWMADVMGRCADTSGLRAPEPKRLAQAKAAFSGVSAQAILYVGPAATLLQDAADQSLYLDPAYVAEWNRTRLCCLPAEAVKIDPDQVLRENTKAPRPYKHP